MTFWFNLEVNLSVDNNSVSKNVILINARFESQQRMNQQRKINCI